MSEALLVLNGPKSGGLSIESTGFPSEDAREDYDKQVGETEIENPIRKSLFRIGLIGLCGCFVTCGLILEQQRGERYSLLLVCSLYCSGGVLLYETTIVAKNVIKYNVGTGRFSIP